MTSSETRKRRLSIGNVLLMYGVYLVYLILLAVISILAKGFLSPSNLLHLLTQASVLIIVCVGNTFVLLSAGIDMSVGSIAFFGPALAAYLISKSGLNPYMAIVLVLVVGALLGSLNGVIVRQFNIYPLITTLGVLFAGRGMGQYLIQGGAHAVPAEIRFIGNGAIIGIPVSIIIAAVFLVVGQLVLRNTTLGRQVVAVGDNEEAAVKSGINVPKIKFTVYLISGIASAVAGLVLSGEVTVVDPGLGNGMEFDVLIALVVGGVSVFGAKGSVFPGAFIGVLFLQTIFNGLVAANASPYLFPVLKGIVIFAAILLDTIKTRNNVLTVFRSSRGESK